MTIQIALYFTFVIGSLDDSSLIIKLKAIDFYISPLVGRGLKQSI